MALLTPPEERLHPQIEAFEPVARPIFVVGAPRSGASLLTLSLGQHFNIEQVMETNWFERMAISLQQTYTAGISPRETSQLDASGLDIGDFSAWFGESINKLMLDQISGSEALSPHRRWVDGSRDLTRDLFPLLRLFPRAKIIHVFREAGEVVGAFTNPENRPLYKSRYVEMSVSDATSKWTQAVTACVDAERAFGSATVLRVHRRDLVNTPEVVLRRCLEFVDEPFDTACLRPFRPLEYTTDFATLPPKLEVHRERVPVTATADLISKMLTEEGNPNYPGDEVRQVELEIAFGKRAERETKVIEQAGRPKSGKSSKSKSLPESEATLAGDDRGLPSLVRSIRKRIGKSLRSGARTN